MAVPEEIRRVPRPKNTVVVDYGKDSANRWAVRERKSVKYVKGGNPQPKNGRVIGHIMGGRYVPLKSKEEIRDEQPRPLRFGAAAFAHSVSDDILRDLEDVFDPKEAYMIIAIAMLRIIKPGIPAYGLKSLYLWTYVSVYYPGTPLSHNTISSFLNRLGSSWGQMMSFYRARTARVCENHHIAIDGTLKQDTSCVNDLSRFSWKSRIKGVKNISIIYAFDIEEMEPICAEVFPGNAIDATCYSSFIRDNDIKRGIIIADKGFPPRCIKEELDDRPDLHFLTPIKRNDVRIKNNDMLSFEGVFMYLDDEVTYKKAKIKGGRYLYAYRSDTKRSKESHDFLRRRITHDDYTHEAEDKKSALAGVIVFESDLDMDPKVAYASYQERWLLETVFDQYKNEECLDATHVHDNSSVIGSEFINFIATLITCRMLIRARETGVMDHIGFGELMNKLGDAWRMSDAPSDVASDDQYWRVKMSYAMDMLEALGLSKPAPEPAPKKRGRPRKNPLPSDV